MPSRNYHALRLSRARRRALAGRDDIDHRHLKNLEIRFIRLQTIFAGLGIFLSAVISVAGLWIGVQLSETNDRQRRQEMELTAQSKAAEIARSSAIACIDQALKLREVPQQDFPDAEYINLKRAVIERCRTAKIRLDEDKFADEILQHDSSAIVGYLIGKMLQNPPRAPSKSGMNR